MNVTPLRFIDKLFAIYPSAIFLYVSYRSLYSASSRAWSFLASSGKLCTRLA